MKAMAILVVFATAAWAAYLADRIYEHSGSPLVNIICLGVTLGAFAVNLVSLSR